MRGNSHSGFTLIELSIVLVIIGLIVGGVLVGQDLIGAAATRAQIAQIEKYQTAVNTFRVKYGGLPGDLSTAAQFGFAPRGQYAGEGDGNDLLEGVVGNCSGCNDGSDEATGETPLFWRDLGDANLIDGNFPNASATAPPSTDITLTTSPNLDGYFPRAKIGGGNHIYVWSGGWQKLNTHPDQKNYFGILVFDTLYTYGQITSNGLPEPHSGVTVIQASNIDQKMDDGLPQSGNVIAFGYGDWASAPGYDGAMDTHIPSSEVGAYGPTTDATPHASYNCYDNNNVVGPQQYSIYNGNALNCALSFQFQ